jgi:NAD+ kinase
MVKRNSKIKSLGFYFRPDSQTAADWAKKIRRWLKKNHKEIKLDPKKPDVLVVLGGDGTILEAARICQKTDSVILGLNLGTIGFLSSVRQPANFIGSLSKLLKGNYSLTEHILLDASIRRKGKTMFTSTALNEIAVINPLGMVELKVIVNDYLFQSVRGTGMIVATPTGSTAYNLSAHGPAVMPDLKALILTKLLDHNIPTPSVVLRDDRKIILKISHFRKRRLLRIADSQKTVDVILAADGEVIYPLVEGDEIFVNRSPRQIKFVRFEANYFIKSLKEKFSFS